MYYINKTTKTGGKKKMIEKIFTVVDYIALFIVIFCIGCMNEYSDLIKVFELLGIAMGYLAIRFLIALYHHKNN